jgi:hypothetical protein
MSTQRTMRLEIFADPLYGSEQFVTFEPEWVVKAQDATKSLLFRHPVPVTHLTFSNGDSHVVHGHWAEQIKAAQLAPKGNTTQKE